MSYKKNVGRGGIARNEQFFLFPHCFYPFGELFAIFLRNEIVICQLFQFGRIKKKKMTFGKELKMICVYRPRVYFATPFNYYAIGPMQFQNHQIYPCTHLGLKVCWLRLAKVLDRLRDRIPGFGTRVSQRHLLD